MPDREINLPGLRIQEFVCEAIPAAEGPLRSQNSKVSTNGCQAASQHLNSSVKHNLESLSQLSNSRLVQLLQANASTLTPADLKNIHQIAIERLQGGGMCGEGAMELARLAMVAAFSLRS